MKWQQKLHRGWARPALEAKYIMYIIKKKKNGKNYAFDIHACKI